MNTNNFRFKNYLTFLIILTSMFGAFQQSSKAQTVDEKTSLKIKLTDTQYTCFYGKTSVQVYFKKPKVANGKLILVLPGWNYPVLDWKNKTRFVDTALHLGYSLLMVDMGKSVYMASIYDNARSDYKTFPTRTWLWEQILQPYQKFGWFCCEDSCGHGNTSVIGLSTGARGALLLALDHFGSFENVIALSGDYDCMLDTSDALLRNSMGPYWKNPFRWHSGSNQIVNRVNLLSSYLYVAHGLQDKVVPCKHTQLLVKAIEKSKRQTTYPRRPVFEIYDKYGGHNYEFWDKYSIICLREMQKQKSQIE